MRSVGGAGIICFACLLGCASMPPPAGPAPPTVAPPAPTAASPPEAAVEWDARAGTLLCRSTKITVPPELREQVRWTNTDELALLPPGAPAGGALVIGLIEADDDGRGALDFFEDAALTWLRLQLLAGGGLLGAVDMSLSGSSNFEDGQLAADYTLGDRKGKAVYLQTQGCRIAALDFPLSSERAPLTNLLDTLAARIRAQLPETVIDRRARARFQARTRAGGD
jgi:hypothetical protein